MKNECKKIIRTTIKEGIQITHNHKKTFSKTSEEKQKEKKTMKYPFSFFQ